MKRIKAKFGHSTTLPHNQWWNQLVKTYSKKGANQEKRKTSKLAVKIAKKHSPRVIIGPYGVEEDEVDKKARK